MKVFDTTWHKLHFAITSDYVKLHVDCKWIETAPLFRRGPIDVDGEILLGKKANGETLTVNNTTSNYKRS